MMLFLVVIFCVSLMFDKIRIFVYYSKSCLGNNNKKPYIQSQKKKQKQISKMYSRKQFQTGEVVFIILDRMSGEIYTGELFACLWDRQGTRAVIYVAFLEEGKKSL